MERSIAAENKKEEKEKETMMKKMVSMAMAAVMAATLMVAAAPATEVKAASNSEIKVSYENTSVLVDPENPDVMVKVPASITFTDDVKTVDASVTLESTDGSAITSENYTGSATVTVASANGYKLKFGSETLDYTLKYDGQTANGTAVGSLSASALTIGGSATLGAGQVATQLGEYVDTLTYTITFSE